MKFYTLMIVLAGFAASGQSASYKENLKKNIRVFESSKTDVDFTKAAAGFERQALSEKKEWLPYYYAGLSEVLAAFQTPKTEIDGLCDKAENFAGKADSLSKNNSEVLVLKSMIAAARINVNQAKRGQKYGMMATRFANEAIKLNDANPRAYFVKAQATLYTPVAFGGGEKKAKPIFELVIEKASRQGVTKAESSLHPNWGKEEAEKELQKMASAPAKAGSATKTKNNQTKK